jgi:hypothetical protein
MLFYTAMHWLLIHVQVMQGTGCWLEYKIILDSEP